MHFVKLNSYGLEKPLPQV